MQHKVVINRQRMGLPLHLKLLPQHLNDLGYLSHAVGKWHLGHFHERYTSHEMNINLLNQLEVSVRDGFNSADLNYPDKTNNNGNFISDFSNWIEIR